MDTKKQQNDDYGFLVVNNFVSSRLCIDDKFKSKLKESVEKLEPGQALCIPADSLARAGYDLESKTVTISIKWMLSKMFKDEFMAKIKLHANYTSGKLTAVYVHLKP